MELLFQEDCQVASKVNPCGEPSVVDVKDMCELMEKLPGVNVDHWPLDVRSKQVSPQKAVTFFFAPEGVHI